MATFGTSSGSSNVVIVVEAQNTAGTVAKLETVNTALDKVSNTTKKAASSFSQSSSSIAKSAAVFTTTFLGVGSAIYAMANFTREAIGMATTYQTKLIGLNIQANNLGISSKEVNAAIQSLTKDGFLTQLDAVENLAYMFNGYVQSVPQALSIMQDLQNLAAAGGESMYSYGEKVRGLSESFLTLMSRIGDKRGLAENWNRIIEVGEQVTKKRYEAEGLMGQRLILTAGLHAVAQRATGAYDQMQQSNIGTINKARAGFSALQLTLGNALMPAIVMLAGAFNTSTASGTFFTAMIKVVGSIALVAASAVNVLGTAIGNTLSQVETFVMKGPEAALQQVAQQSGDVNKILTEMGESMRNLWAGTGPAWSDMFGKADLGFLNDVPAQAAKAAKKAAEDMKKEMDEYARSVEKRDRDYKRSLAELIWAHQDKRDSLIKDLDKENAAYKKSNEERLADYNKTLSEMNTSHERKVRDNNQDIIDENDDYANKIRDVEEEIARERAKGIYLYGIWNSAASSDRIYELQQEMDDATKEHQKRLAALQIELSDENEDYKTALEEKKAIFQEETLAAQTEHDTRIADLQAELNTENQILAQHNVEVAGIKDMQKQDDIARLISQHAEEVAEDIRSHNERLEGIKKAALEGGTAYGGGIKTAAQTGFNDLKAVIDDATKSGAIKMGIGGSDAGKSWVSNMWDGIKNQFQAMKIKAADTASWFASKTGFNFDWLKFTGVYQHGGIVPGPVGAPVPIIAHAGESIIPRGSNTESPVGSGGGAISINFYGNIAMDSEDRVRELSRTIMRMLSRESELGRYGCGY